MKFSTQLNTPIFKIRPQSKQFIHKVMINIVLLSLLMGYTMVYFNAINFDDLIIIFQLKMDRAFAQGLLTGCIPASACVGALLSQVLLTTFTRKHCIDVMNGMCILAIILIQTKNIPLIIIGRMLQGSFIGAGTAILPLYIKQFIPQLNGKYGLYHQILFITGVLLAFLLNLIFHSLFTNPEVYWRWHFGFPMIVSIYQLYMIHYHYNFQTPRYLISQDRNDEALDLLKIIYKDQFVEKQFHILFEAVHAKKFNPRTGQYTQFDSPIKSLELQQNRQLSQFGKGHNINNKKETSYIQQNLLKKQHKPLNSPLAVFCALHLSFHQQVIGIGAVIVYSGDIIKQVIPSIFYFYSVIVHTFGLICVILGLKLIQMYGRVLLMQIGGILMSICYVFIGINFLRGDQRNDYVIVFAVIFVRGVFSCTLGPIVWLYMAEIVKPNIVPYGTFINWAGATMVMFLFPIVSEMLGGPGWIFIFNASVCVISMVINVFTLVETKDKHQLTIRHNFDERLEKIKKHEFFQKCFS